MRHKYKVLYETQHIKYLYETKYIKYLDILKA